MTRSTSTSPAVVNKYIWSLDGEGNLRLHNKIPPYTYDYYVYVQNRDLNTDWPQIAPKSVVDQRVAQGNSFNVKGCIDSITGELKLDAAFGRKNMLWCGQQMWISKTLGEEINRGVCLLTKPKVIFV